MQIFFDEIQNEIPLNYSLQQIVDDSSYLLVYIAEDSLLDIGTMQNIITIFKKFN
jgi:hypothetical protein